MTAEHSVPPPRDLPPVRLAQRKQHLLTEIRHESKPRPFMPTVAFPRRRVVAFAAAVVVAVAAAVVAALTLGTGPASGTPTLPEPLAFAHGSHQQAVAILDHASALQEQAVVGVGSVRYAKTRNYALQVDVSRNGATTTVETTLREVWLAASGTALAKSWLQDTTRAGTPVGPATPESTDVHWQDTNTSLPSTPGAMKSTLLGGTRATGDVLALILAQSIMAHLGEGTATPNQVAALYTLLAHLPGVFDAGAVTDDAGRTGHAVGIPTGTFDAGKTCLNVTGTPTAAAMNAALARHHVLGEGVTYLVLDPATGKPLQVEAVDTPNAPCALALPREPTVQQYNLLLQAGQVAQVGQVP